MTDYNISVKKSLLDTLINIIGGYLIAYESSKAIFKETIDFMDDLYHNLEFETILNLLPFLSYTEYESLPPVKYISSDIKNIASLKNSPFIQRDAEPIVELSDLIWSNSFGDINTYAQKSFDYVLNDIKYNFAPDQSAYGTLYYKSGVCYGKMNLYAALCRRKGIPTRFKIIPFRLTQGFESLFLSFVPEELEFFKPWVVKLINVKIPHHWLEIFLDNSWWNASPVQPALLYKELDIPSPGVDKERRIKAGSNKKAGYAEPMYMSEIYSFFNVAAGLMGRTKIADMFNKKIDGVMKEYEN